MQVLKEEIGECLERMSEGYEAGAMSRMFILLQRVRRASPEIEGIINFFSKKPLEHNLLSMTYRYILHSYEGFDQVANYVFQHQRLQERKALIAFFEVESSSEEDSSYEAQTPEKRQRKSKRYRNDNDCSEEGVWRRLENLMINENRNECHVHRDWLVKLKNSDLYN